MKKIIIFLFFIQTTFAYEKLIVEPDDGRKSLIKAIGRAHKTINITLYEFTDWQIYHALVKAKQRGIKVNIFLEPKPYGYPNANNKIKHAFLKHKIKVIDTDKKFYLTHQKSMVIDNKKAFILTFNFTWRSFYTARNFGVITDDKKIIKAIQQKSKRKNLLWCPDDCRQKLEKFINKSTSELNLYEQALNDFEINSLLTKKSDAGLRIKILIPKQETHRYCQQINYLTRHHVIIHASKNYYIHAKVIFNKEGALIGSMNLSNTSLDNNRELGIITQNKKVLKKLGITYEKDWRDSTRIKKCA